MRSVSSKDLPFLTAMAVAACYDPRSAIPADAEKSPRVQEMVEAWGRAGDVGVIAYTPDGQRQGAAWCRIFRKPLAYSSDGRPLAELAVAVEESQRGKGVGSALLDELVRLAARQGHAALTLKVSHQNPRARELYERVGFRTFHTTGRGVWMRLDLDLSGFELRSFRADDAKAVWELHDLALEDAGAHGGHGPWEHDLRDIRASYLDAGGEFLVGLLDGELVAAGGVIRQSGEEAEIKRMRVHPNFQRRGLGRLLLERLEDRALELGCKTIQLDTTDQQTAAQRLYESAGYRETGRRQTARFVFIDYAKTLR